MVLEAWSTQPSDETGNWVKTGLSRFRQARVASSIDYKEYLDELLTKLENSGVSAYIETTYCGTPTCAKFIVLEGNVMRSLQLNLRS